MSKIKLEDLVPEEAEFTLKSTGKTYYMRPVNIGDEAFIKKEFNGDLKGILEDPESFSRLVFRLLKEESKKEFAVQDVTFIDENGESVKAKLGGYKLFYCVVQGVNEKNMIAKCLLKCFGFSDKVLNDLENTEKKTLEAAEMKQTGEISSTF